MEGGNKCLCVVVLADQKIASFGASYIACCQTHSDYGPPKMPLKLTV